MINQSKQTFVAGDSKLVRLLCVSGHCSDLVFQVEFQLSEVKVSLFIV